MIRSFCLFLVVCMLSACDSQDDHLFTLLSSKKTGITFKNFIYEDEELNIINQEYLYNGGGVAAADFNKDGLVDLFFTGNMVDNELYLNKGNFKFENITEFAGIQAKNQWKSGVALIDINNDGLLDIYVCSTMDSRSEKRKNLLFVHQGIEEDGKVSFEEQAEEYGIADDSYTANAAFLDYDNDEDLDLFLLVNSKQFGVPTVYREKVLDGSSDLTDKLYRNNGDGSFTDVSQDAGILIEGHGLGVSILDINQDGWSDIYVANDFLTNDVLYINHEGVFKDEIDHYFKHQSKFSMGTDVADVNKDGQLDLITVDMMPELNSRKKTVIQGGMYINYINDKRYDYTHQYTRNMLQISNENGSYSELGQFSGIHQTEWSWSPLLADFDNDGHHDLMITNGFPKDITDKDFINFRMKINRVASAEFLDDQLPSVKVPNYAYKGMGNGSFEDVSEQWGITQPSFSNGAIYADLDNDGDLDYVVNNIYDEAFVYRNNNNPGKEEAQHYLQVQLTGSQENYLAQGTKLGLYSEGESFIHEHSVYRGYISTVDGRIHFGLGERKSIDSLVILWPGKEKSVIKDIEINELVSIDYNEILRFPTNQLSLSQAKPKEALVEEVADQRNLNYVQEDYDVIDYSYQQTIPHKFSQFGPALAVGDIDGNGHDDLVIGTVLDRDLSVYFQNPDGTFDDRKIEKEGMHNDGSLLLFDADGDNDLDLYIVSGGFKEFDQDKAYRDRFYRNEGGNLIAENSAVPATAISGSVARAADFDLDGDLDIFVGGRIVPHNYPLAPDSYILVNTGGQFNQEMITLSDLGMVSDAIWTDYDQDGDPDLFVASEFQPLQILENQSGKFERLQNSDLDHYKGWWQSVIGDDFDGDGDIDYVAGNFGTNNSYNVDSEHPMFVYALDIDNNNSIDPILACYNKFDDGTYKLCPVNYWEELSAQSPVFRRRFQSYKSYGNATIDSVLTKEEIKRSIRYEANYFLSSYIENLGEGKFKVSPLPSVCQISPMKGIISTYINDDPHLDLVMIGNDYSIEVSVGNMDAFNGMILLGKGDGSFIPQGNGDRGFLVPNDGKALVEMISGEQRLYIASQNKEALLSFAGPYLAGTILRPVALETSARIRYKDGSAKLKEFYYGVGYLSQSSRFIEFTKEMKSVDFYQGNQLTRTYPSASEEL